jgi:hypothetical protein
MQCASSLLDVEVFFWLRPTAALCERDADQAFGFFGGKRVLQGFDGAVGKNDLHRRGFLPPVVFRALISLRRNVTAARAVSKGP